MAKRCILSCSPLKGLHESMALSDRLLLIATLQARQECCRLLHRRE